MASLVVNQGLQRCGKQTFESTNYNAAREVQTGSVDDSSTALAAGHTALNSGGAVTNEFDVARDATPTESSQTIIFVYTIPTVSGNFTIRRLCEHDDTAANVTTSSTTLFGGVDNQQLTKTSDFSLAVTKNYTFSSV